MSHYRWRTLSTMLCSAVLKASVEFLPGKQEKKKREKKKARRQLSLTWHTFIFHDPRAYLIHFFLLFRVAGGKHGGLLKAGVTRLLHFPTSLKKNGRVLIRVRMKFSPRKHKWEFNTHTNMHASLFNLSWSMAYYKVRSAFMHSHARARARTHAQLYVSGLSTFTTDINL